MNGVDARARRVLIDITVRIIKPNRIFSLRSRLFVRSQAWRRASVILDLTSGKTVKSF